MRNNSFFKIILITVTVVFISCDKDFNSIGGDLIGNEHFGLEQTTYDVTSYNQKIGPIQSNNLLINQLGLYEDPVFGTTTANFTTQLVLASVNPIVGANPEIENVVLNIPYFSHIKSTDAAGDNTYVLDSIYGNENGKIKLSVYESGYFLRDLDPTASFLEPQKYYTNQDADFDGFKKAALLNNSTSVSQNDEFFFDAAEFKETTTVDDVTTTTRTAPAMRLFLDEAYFKAKIIDVASKAATDTNPAVISTKLITNDVFKDYFRGLYFKVEKSGSNPGRLAMMDFRSGTITIKFKEDSTTEVGVRVDRSIVLNFTGNTVNLLSNDLSNATGYASATASPNDVSGDDKLYLKGGEGAMAVLDLFDKTDVRGYDADGNPTLGSNGVYDQLDDLRNPVGKKKWLINEANLVFHIDGGVMGANKIPSRVYLYDLTNNTAIVDYLVDGTTGTNAKNGLLVYGGLLNTTKEGDFTYKIRITNHIRSLINNKDSTNVKLGLVVTENINNSAMSKLRLPLPQGSTLTKAPQASVMSPLGVVLHGGTSVVPEAKKLKLEIYYTKPN